MTIDDKSNNKQKRNQKNNMSSTLKEALSEAMKEGGSWMNHMKQDYEVQLRTQKDMVSMYSRQNKELEEKNDKLKEEIRHLEDRAVANYDCHMNQYKELKKQNEELEEKLKKQKADGGQTIQDINGKEYQMPTQEQADHFGISLEEMIKLMKTTDCDFSD